MRRRGGEASRRRCVFFLFVFFLYGFFFLENKVTKPWFDREIKASPTAIPEIYNINTLI